ncbi:MAG: PIG-L family deacetylase [candidate division WOR-3 bacterium]|nr:PIG-L family deacetylase [candidate division WOR-3 bacterium]
MDRKLRIVVFGAHIGDAEITCGHVIAKYINAGHRATIVHLTPGEKGNSELPPEEYKNQKIEEAESSAKILGCNLKVLSYRDGELPLNEEVKLEICDLIRELKPDIVLTHWKGSFHKDHINTHFNVVEGIFYAALQGIKRKLPAWGVSNLYFADNWEDAIDFVPNICLDITNTYQTWLEAISKHALFRGEIASFPYREYYEALSIVRGARAGFKHAACFMIPEHSDIRKGDFFPVEEKMLIY